ncbi:hypothetical protein [Labedaea rhizosphaerae]|nr:hypothetical protein [Labedaea rhizosphaerae]
MNVTPGSTATLAVRLRANSAMAADPVNNAYLSVSAFWAPSKLV